ncbi:MAG: TAXI family TRAP transporter solute-binding subunit [Alphaproteobacteria bacterium]|nr:TAXI family TRAP transporter solute-binding subunit [Alphaproteobacteria bacterium]
MKRVLKLTLLLVALLVSLGIGGLIGVALVAPVVMKPPSPETSGVRPQDEPRPSTKLITVGTGGVTGVYYPSGGAICRMVNRGLDQHGVRCLIDSTAGSLANLNALRAGRLDFAIAQSDWHYHALKGSAAFSEDGSFRSLRSVFALHDEPFAVIARRDSGIGQFRDLPGKRVNVGNPGSGHRATMEVLMAKYGWTLKDFAQAAEFKTTEQAMALCERGLDALIFMSGHPAASLSETTETCDTRLIPVVGPEVAALIDEHPYYFEASIPGGLYQGTPDPVPTFGVGATLVTTKDQPEEVVYELVRAVFEEFEEFRSLHPALTYLERARLASHGLSAPLHTGAERYFKEAGLR